MNSWLIIVTFLSCISQCEAYGPHFVAKSRDEPIQRSHHTVQNSKIVQKLLQSDNYAAPSYPSSSRHISAYNLFNDHRACASWSTVNYWDAALQLFGRPYPLYQQVNLPSEYKCFCTDATHQYYIHDAERYAIMEQWPLYEYPAFWSFIQNYPDYQDCMLAINDIVANDYAVQQRLSFHAVQRIQNEAQRISQQRWRQAVMLEQQQRVVIQNTFAGQASKLYQEVSEYNDLVELRTQYALGDSDYLKKRQAIASDMQHRGACYENKSYTMPQSAQDLLRKNGHDTALYTAFYGNQLQQLVHQDCISLLEQTSVVSATSVAHRHKDALVDCIDAAREYNQAGLTQKALHVTDFCRALLDYGKAILTGAVHGAVGAVQDCLEHPIQTALCVAAGEYVLAYQLCKVVFNVAEIGVTSLINTERGAQKWQDFIAPANIIINALYNKEVSLRDAVKGATQLAIQWKAQSKLLGGLGKFYKATKDKVLEFAAKNPLASPEQYMVTPEGFAFKVSLVAENNKLSGHCGNIGKEVSKRELVLAKVQTYEQAKNKGLEIIGDVDVHTSMPHICTVGEGLKGKIVGRRWHGKKVTLRLDYDPTKGAHINVTDYRNGKTISVAIPFEASEAEVIALSRPLNTKASLEAAKSILEKTDKYPEDLHIITETLNNFKE